MFSLSRDQYENDTLLKRLGSLQEVLECRENRVMELSKENVELQETNNHLRSRIQRIEESHCKDSEDTSKMTREFSQRFSQVEKQLEETIRQRDNLEDLLTVLRQQTSSSMSLAEMESLLAEKEEQVAQLLIEGEKLSKQQLNLSNIIKKLRSKEKETESTLKSQKDKLEEQNKELERLRKSLGAKDDQEKKHIDAIRQLTSKSYKQDEEIGALKNELEDSQVKLNSMKNNLEGAYREMTNAQKQLALKENEIQEAAMSAEMVAKENLLQQLTEVQNQSEQERNALLGQVTELRLTLQQADFREDSLKADIENLQRRLEESDAKNDELNQSILQATRPLLRQLESLQNAHSSHTTSWDKVEKALNEKLTAAQEELGRLKERESRLRGEIHELKSRLLTSENKNKTLGHDKVQMTSQLEILKAKLSLGEESKQRDAKLFGNVKQKFAEEITALKKEKDEALIQLETLKDDFERRKMQIEVNPEETFQEEESGGRSSPSLSMTLSHHSSVSESFRHWGQDMGSEVSEQGARPMLYENWWGGSASTMIETLQSQVKMRDGEVQHLQREISRLEQIRESMAEELGTLSRKVEEMEIQLTDLQSHCDVQKDVEQKYNTLLQMYGEKVEEAEELRLDLSDVKAMYRAQIEELLRKS